MSDGGGNNAGACCDKWEAEFGPGVSVSEFLSTSPFSIYSWIAHLQPLDFNF
jgi:hypothetical protein